MSIEQTQWDAQPPREEEPQTPAESQEQPSESIEEGETQLTEQEEHDKHWEDLAKRVWAKLEDDSAARQHAVQRLTQQGLFDKNEYESYVYPYHKKILDITLNTISSDALINLAKQLPEGEERTRALHLESELRSWNAFTESDMMREMSRRDFRHSKDYGTPTVKEQMRLLETLHHFEIINSETFESEKQSLLAELQEESS